MGVPVAVLTHQILGQREKQNRGGSQSLQVTHSQAKRGGHPEVPRPQPGEFPGHTVLSESR